MGKRCVSRASFEGDLPCSTTLSDNGTGGSVRVGGSDPAGRYQRPAIVWDDQLIVDEAEQ